jgi:hypothetical protein
MTLEHALAGIESQLTKCLVDAARKDWRAAAWWLERRRPEVYGDAKAKIDDDDAPTAGTARVIYLVDSDKAQELLSAQRAQSKT